VRSTITSIRSPGLINNESCTLFKVSKSLDLQSVVKGAERVAYNGLSRKPPSVPISVHDNTPFCNECQSSRHLIGKVRDERQHTSQIGHVIVNNKKRESHEFNKRSRYLVGLAAKYGHAYSFTITFR
jgi:hypothetical protein